MLEVVVPFNIADAICDTDYAIDRMSTDVVAFGFKGHDVVVKVKEEELVRGHSNNTSHFYETFLTHPPPRPTVGPVVKKCAIIFKG